MSTNKKAREPRSRYEQSDESGTTYADSEFELRSVA